MKKEVILPLFLLVIFLGCVEKVTENSTIENVTTTIKIPIKEFEISLSTDKEIYHSDELMNISVKVVSSEKVEDARITVYGIHSRQDKSRKKKITNLEKGESEFHFSYQTPRCYGCAGISPGMYDITAELEYNGKIKANATIEVDIRK